MTGVVDFEMGVDVDWDVGDMGFSVVWLGGLGWWCDWTWFKMTGVRRK